MVDTSASVSSNPFALQVDPDQVVGHPAWQRARAAALDVLGAGGRAVLVGRTGCGKSLMLRMLAGTLRRDDRAVRTLAHAAPFEGGGHEVLLVDDAELYDAAALARLCVGAGAVLLAGPPDLTGRLPHGFGPFRRIVLERLSDEDVARFVATRLAAVGRPGLLEAEAVFALARASTGLPRLVNTIGSAAVFLAGLEGSAVVGQRHVAEATMDDDRETSSPPSVPAVPRAEPLAGPGAEAIPALRSYRGKELGRRVALGGMLALSAGLFGVPWLLRRRVDGAGPAFAQDAVRGGGVESAQAPAPALPTVAEAVPGLDEPRAPAVIADGGTAGGLAKAQGGADVPAVAGHGSDRQMAAEDAGAMGLDAPALFRGPIFNETIGQGGRVTLAIGRRRTDGAFTARFEASQGLSGRGVLAGVVSGTGRITASGQLLMGRNPFLCDLSGMLSGDTLTGSASFVRPGAATVYHSRFSLVRA